MYVGSTRYFTKIQNVGRVKSPVDDLIMERGTVSMRVAFVLRSAEVQPLFRDLCDIYLQMDYYYSVIVCVCMCCEVLVLYFMSIPTSTVVAIRVYIVNSPPPHHYHYRHDDDVHIQNVCLSYYAIPHYCAHTA
jgi:hypothetical protein